MITTQQEEIDVILESMHFSFVDAWEVEEWQRDNEDFTERLFDRASEQEIIYYYKAMEYLNDNDNSLMESLALASDCGYTVDELNSELLATLHYQHSLQNDVYELASKLEAYFAGKKGE